LPRDRQGTINCILVGVTIGKLLEQGKEEEAKGHLERLTSDLTPEDIDSLIFRLRIYRRTTPNPP